MRRSAVLYLLLSLLFPLCAELGWQRELLAEPPVAPARQTLGLFPRREINTKIMGVNAFANEPRFGTVRAQLKETKDTLRLNYLRVLFAWNDQVQPSPDVAPNFSFYDDIASHIPRRSQALVIMTGLPSWMSDESNWIDGNPRKTFVELWVKKVVARYKNNRRIKAWEIWNEPDMDSNQDNVLLEMNESPANYLEMLGFAQTAIRALTPGKLIVGAATTSINQNYPENLNYNQEMKDLGGEALMDIWNIHYYGTNYENVLLGGVDDFLKSITLPIWVTESGAKGTTKQRAYVEEVWPFLDNLVPNIARFYYYQFTETTPASSTYGLKNLTRGKTLSNLYIYLRDRPRGK